MCIRDRSEIVSVLSRHLKALHQLYGEYQGTRIARKHMGWTLDWLGLREVKQEFNRCQNAEDQFSILHLILDEQTAA